MSSTTYLYWVHLPSYTDPLTQGYIGITVDKKERFNCHRKTFKDYFAQGAVITVLNEYDDRDTALRIEADYRPAPNIGWNTHPGSIKRLTNSRPPISTTSYVTSRGNNAGQVHKLVNMRIPASLWEDFQLHCKEKGTSASERMREMMVEDIDTTVEERQFEFDFWN